MINHHQPVPEELPLPRHLMASHALSNLMASEISYGNHQHYLQSIQHSQRISASERQPIQNNHSYQGGWKMYQSLAPGSIVVPPQSSSSLPPPPSQPQKAFRADPSSSYLDNGPAEPSSSSHSNKLAPEPTLCPSELTERPPARHSTPAFDNLPESYPLAANEYSSSLPTVYIYPTEARDIGSEVPGQSALGPQNYRDSFWIAAWLSSLLYAFAESVWVFLISPSNPTEVGGGDDDERERGKLGLMKSLPILALLITVTFGFCLISLSLLLLVKRSIRYLVYGTILGVPTVLGMIGLWTWSEAISEEARSGMGWVSLLAVGVAGVFMRFMWAERGRIERTIQVLSLSVGVLVAHPSLVMASLGLSMACIVSSIPFLSLILQLLLSGKPQESQWVINSGALGHALVAGFVWSWSLNVIRNLQRIVVAGVVSHWYFNRHSPPGMHQRKAYSSLDSTCQSISRALGPSLGTVCLSAFLLTVFDSSSKLFKFLKRLSSPSSSSPSGFFCCTRNILLAWLKIWIDFSSRILDFLGSFTLIYAGITGFNFSASFRKTQSLVFKHAQIGLFHNLLVKLILNLVALTISLTISLIGYHIYTSSSSSKPINERLLLLENLGPFICIFFGLLPFWILRFLTDLISTSVDTLFLCWNIDLDIGTNHSNLTRQAFVGKLED